MKKNLFSNLNKQDVNSPNSKTNSSLDLLNLLASTSKIRKQIKATQAERNALNHGQSSPKSLTVAKTTQKAQPVTQTTQPKAPARSKKTAQASQAAPSLACNQTVNATQPPRKINPLKPNHLAMPQVDKTLQADNPGQTLKSPRDKSCHREPALGKAPEIKTLESLYARDTLATVQSLNSTASFKLTPGAFELLECVHTESNLARLSSNTYSILMNCIGVLEIPLRYADTEVDARLLALTNKGNLNALATINRPHSLATPVATASSVSLATPEQTAALDLTANTDQATSARTKTTYTRQTAQTIVPDQTLTSTSALVPTTADSSAYTVPNSALAPINELSAPAIVTSTTLASATSNATAPDSDTTTLPGSAPTTADSTPQIVPNSATTPTPTVAITTQALQDSAPAQTNVFLSHAYEVMVNSGITTLPDPTTAAFSTVALFGSIPDVVNTNELAGLSPLQFAKLLGNTEHQPTCSVLQACGVPQHTPLPEELIKSELTQASWNIPQPKSWYTPKKPSLTSGTVKLVLQTPPNDGRPSSTEKHTDKFQYLSLHLVEGQPDSAITDSNSFGSSNRANDLSTNTHDGTSNSGIMNSCLASRDSNTLTPHTANTTKDTSATYTANQNPVAPVPQPVTPNTTTQLALPEGMVDVQNRFAHPEANLTPTQRLAQIKKTELWINIHFDLLRQLGLQTGSSTTFYEIINVLMLRLADNYRYLAELLHGSAQLIDQAATLWFNVSVNYGKFPDLAKKANHLWNAIATSWLIHYHRPWLIFTQHATTLHSTAIPDSKAASATTLDSSFALNYATAPKTQGSSHQTNQNQPQTTKARKAPNAQTKEQAQPQTSAQPHAPTRQNNIADSAHALHVLESQNAAIYSEPALGAFALDSARTLTADAPQSTPQLNANTQEHPQMDVNTLVSQQLSFPEFDQDLISRLDTFWNRLDALAPTWLEILKSPDKINLTPEMLLKLLGKDH